MNIEQLKVRAYDLIALIQQAQNELQVVNREIAELNLPKSDRGPISGKILDESTEIK